MGVWGDFKGERLVYSLHATNSTLLFRIFTLQARAGRALGPVKLTFRCGKLTPPPSMKMVVFEITELPDAWDDLASTTLKIPQEMWAGVCKANDPVVFMSLSSP